MVPFKKIHQIYHNPLLGSTLLKILREPPWLTTFDLLCKFTP
jgi:hypothetical protein